MTFPRILATFLLIAGLLSWVFAGIIIYLAVSTFQESTAALYFLAGSICIGFASLVLTLCQAHDQNALWTLDRERY